MREDSGRNQVLGGGGIHHVALKASDFDASVKFYCELLGFIPVLAWGEADGRGIMLDTGRGDCIEIFAGGVPGDRPEGAWLHLALKCEDVDGVLQKIRSAGRPVIMEPTDITIASATPLDIRIAFFRGPDGEILELFHEK
jgi:catechol 2,3-dioxygenase-like lactoylglutathione lyase family enzyme